MTNLGQKVIEKEAKTLEECLNVFVELEVEWQKQREIDRMYGRDNQSEDISSKLQELQQEAQEIVIEQESDKKKLLVEEKQPAPTKKSTRRKSRSKQ